MWVFLNNAFLSIVAPAPYDNVDPDQYLKVRGRFAGDIERTFPGAKVICSRSSDYLYRAFVERGEVAVALAQHLLNCSYTNFKVSVEDVDRHATYLQVWARMHCAQEDARIRKSRVRKRRATQRQTVPPTSI